MKKTKLKQRFENAVNAFFDDALTTESNSLAFAGPSDLSRENYSKEITGKLDVLLTVLKQVFFFFPGTFFLYFISFAFTIISISNPYLATLSSHEAVRVGIVFLGSILFTWFGLGELRKPKHLAIPASIMAVGITVGAVSGVLSNLFPVIQRIIWQSGYPVYFIPLALMIPFLAKNWVDNREAISE